MQISYALAFLCLLGPFYESAAQGGTCGGDCVWSEDCMLDAGDTGCRCSYFHCKRVEEGTCGGGCLTDEQCRTYSGGDANCKCSVLFECETSDRMKEPGYETYVRFIQLTRGDQLKRKQERITKALDTIEGTGGYY